MTQTTSNSMLSVSSGAPKTLELRDCLDAVLSRFDAMEPYEDEVFGEYGSRLREIVQQLSIARKEWDARIFVLVVCGPVKAGKSTLVNLLAGNEVSAVSREECTRLPSLVLRTRPDEQERIEMFYSGYSGFSGKGTDSQAEDETRAFDWIMQYVRGMISPEELEHSGAVRVDIQDVTSDMDVKTMMERMDPEPMLVVFRVRPQHGEETIIDERLALVDMPGIDGQFAGEDAVPFHRWILNHADFLLFVQSSVATLTGQVSAFVKKTWQTNHPFLPVWMIHNIIDGKHWRPEKDREREECQHLHAARKEINSLLQVPKLRSFSVNLAMALDSITGKWTGDGDLYATSKFETFREPLQRHISEHHAVIHERNWVQDKVAKRLSRAFSAIEDIKNARQEAAKRRDDLEKMLRTAREILHNDSFDQQVLRDELDALGKVAVQQPSEDTGDMKEVDKDMFSYWRDEAKQRIDHYLPAAMVSGANLQKRARLLLDEFSKTGATLMKSSRKLNRLRDAVQKEVDEYEAPVRKELGDILGAEFSPPPAAPFTLQRFNSLTFLEQPLGSSDATQKIKTYHRSWKYVWVRKEERRYTADEAEKIFRQIVAGAEREMRERVQRWQEQLELAVREYVAMRQDALHEALNHYEKTLRRSFEKEDAMIEKVDDNLAFLETAVQDIERARKNAVQSLPTVDA